MYIYIYIYICIYIYIYIFGFPYKQRTSKWKRVPRVHLLEIIVQER